MSCAVRLCDDIDVAGMVSDSVVAWDGSRLARKLSSFKSLLALSCSLESSTPY